MRYPQVERLVRDLASIAGVEVARFELCDDCLKVTFRAAGNPDMYVAQIIERSTRADIAHAELCDAIRRVKEVVTK